MTAQIGDFCRYKGDKYEITASSARIPFDPIDYGIEPHWRSTSCYRGYYCEYVIMDTGLFLDNLYINNNDGNYPELCGVLPDPEESCTGTTKNNNYENYRGACTVVSDSKESSAGEKRKIGRRFRGGSRRSLYRRYHNINLLIPYTGKLLLGKDFISECYIHMGYQRSYTYEKVIEAMFENGVLLEVIDRSEAARKKRESMDPEDLIWGETFDTDLDFVESSFSLDYEIKAKWLTEE